MTFDDIKAIKIPAADNCVLFIWATAPMLPHALEVIAAGASSTRAIVSG
jgi:hypothetical protein